MKTIRSVFFVYCLLLGVVNAQNLPTKQNQSTSIDHSDKVSKEKNHIIVLVDRSGSMDRSANFEQNIKKVFNRIIPKLLKDNVNLENDDYLSFVSFGFSLTKPNAKSFIQIADDRLNYGFVYEEYENKKNELFQYFNNSRIYNDFFRKNWSGISFANEMALEYLKNEDVNISNTFFVLVSDDEFNAPNPSYEIAALERQGVRNTNLIEKSWKKVADQFIFENIAEEKVGRINVRMSKLHTSFIDNFNIGKLVDFGNNNESIQLNKIPEGYVLDSESIEFIDDDFIKIISCNIKILGENNKVIKEETLMSPSGVYKLDFNQQIFSSDSKLKSIDFEFRLRVIDGCYNAMVVNSETLSDEKGANFSKHLNIKYEQIGEIFWLFPISDDMHGFTADILGDKSMSKNTTTWNIIISLIISIILFILFLRYVNKNKKDKNAEGVIIE